MKKILLILLVAISVTTFNSCKFVCKMCPPPCGTPTTPSTTKTLNYFVYIIDTLNSSPFKRYLITLNNQSKQDTILGNRGKDINVLYDPITENDSLKVKLYAEKTDGSRVFMAYYTLPIYWSESNGGDTLFQNQVFYNPSPIVLIGPQNPVIPDPVCKRTCPN